MLEASGIEVIDLGIDVAPETIVAAAKEHGVKIVAPERCFDTCHRFHESDGRGV